MSFGTVYSAAWEGSTARSCRGNATRLAVFSYIMTTGHANMIGVFSLPTLYIVYHLGLSVEDIEEALAFLEDDGFLVRDLKHTDYVFVTRMAEIRLNLNGRDGQPLATQDNRLAKAQHLYLTIPSQKLCDAFCDRYAKQLRLKPRVIPKGRGSEAPSEGLTDVPAPHRRSDPIRSSPIQTKRESARGGHRKHAFCGTKQRPDICVPDFLHADFVARLGDAKVDLLSWYGKAVEALGDRPLAQDSVAFFKACFQRDIVPQLENAVDVKPSARGSVPRGTPNDDLKEINGVWGDILDKVEAKVSRHDFHTWFADTTLQSDKGKSIVVTVKAPEVSTWIQKHHAAVLTAAVDSVRPGATVTFKVKGKS